MGGEGKRTHGIIGGAGVKDALGRLLGQLVGLGALALQVVGLAANLGGGLGDAGLLER